MARTTYICFQNEYTLGSSLSTRHRFLFIVTPLHVQFLHVFQSLYFADFNLGNHPWRMYFDPRAWLLFPPLKFSAGRKMMWLLLPVSLYLQLLRLFQVLPLRTHFLVRWPLSFLNDFYNISFPSIKFFETTKEEKACFLGVQIVLGDSD